MGMKIRVIPLNSNYTEVSYIKRKGKRRNILLSKSFIAFNKIINEHGNKLVVNITKGRQLQLSGEMKEENATTLEKQLKVRSTV